VLLPFGQWLIATTLAMDTTFEAFCFQHRFNFCRTVGAVRPDARSCIIRIQYIFDDLAVVDGCVGHFITSHQFVAAIYVDVVLVTIMAFAMLLGPPGIRIFLAPLGGVERTLTFRLSNRLIILG